MNWYQYRGIFFVFLIFMFVFVFYVCLCYCYQYFQFIRRDMKRDVLRNSYDCFNYDLFLEYVRYLLVGEKIFLVNGLRYFFRKVGFNLRKMIFSQIEDIFLDIGVERVWCIDLC